MDLEEVVLDNLYHNPGTSTRKLSARYNVSHTTIWKIAHDGLLYPHHHQPVQELTAADLPNRMNFCRWYMNISRENMNILSKILFVDEASFQRHGLVNHHNMHSWSEQNPHQVFETKFQNNFTLNVWAGIVGDYLVGPFILPRRLNTAEYLRFLNDQLPLLLEEVPLAVRENMWYAHDGAPAHSTSAVRQWLNSNFPERWICRGNDAPVKWPARSPDLTPPMDYFLWDHLKNIIYSNPIDIDGNPTSKDFCSS